MNNDSSKEEINTPYGMVVNSVAMEVKLVKCTNCNSIIERCFHCNEDIRVGKIGCYKDHHFCSKCMDAFRDGT